MDVIDIIMPKLGMTMTAGKVVRWHKQSGDTVTAGEPICEVETDKLNSEIEAEVTGVLTVLTEEGGELGVGATLGQISATEGAERKAPASAGQEGGLEKIATNGTKLAVQRIGTGSPLVLIHGLVVAVDDGQPVARQGQRSGKRSFAGIQAQPARQSGVHGRFASETHCEEHGKARLLSKHCGVITAGLRSPQTPAQNLARHRTRQNGDAARRQYLPSRRATSPRRY